MHHSASPPSKRPKISKNALTANHNIIADKNSSDIIANTQANTTRTTVFEHLSEDTTSLILSFVHGEYPTEKSLADLFYNGLMYASKWGHRNCIRFSQISRNDISINVNENPYSMFGHHIINNQDSTADLRFCLWMCRQKRLTLGSLSYRIDTSLDLVMILHILKSCNISQLRRLDLLGEGYHRDIALGGVGCVDNVSMANAIQKGLPDELIPKVESMREGHFQTSLAEMMTMQQDSFSLLKVISLCVRICIPTCIDLLRKVPKHIEELELELDNSVYIGDYGIDTILLPEWRDRKEGIEKAIENMENLSHLKLTLFAPKYMDVNAMTGIEVMCSTSIRSTSLLKLNCSSCQIVPHYLKEIQCPSLQKLSVRFAVGRIPNDFLASFSHRITELRIFLEILSDGDDDATNNSLIRIGMERIGTWIESMEHLQTLKIRCVGDHNYDGIMANMKIRSKSLISIDTTGSTFNFSISQCICPQLKRLKCEYAIMEESIAMADRPFVRTNGVKPILQIGNEIPFRRQRKVTLKVRQHPFHNMTASETCKVVLKYRAL